MSRLILEHETLDSVIYEFKNKWPYHAGAGLLSVSSEFSVVVVVIDLRLRLNGIWRRK